MKYIACGNEELKVQGPNVVGLEMHRADDLRAKK